MCRVPVRDSGHVLVVEPPQRLERVEHAVSVVHPLRQARGVGAGEVLVPVLRLSLSRDGIVGVLSKGRPSRRSILSTTTEEARL
jgi:hypothetical protein